MATKNPKSTTGKKTTTRRTSNKTQTTQKEATATLDKPQEEEKTETPEATAIPTKKVYWHKACADDTKTTNTKMKEGEVLKLTDATVTRDKKTIPVLSLKRGKRIYYTTDYTPEELKIAQENHKAALEKKEQERKKKEEEKAAKEAAAKKDTNK